MKKFTFCFLMLILFGFNLPLKAQQYVPLGISSGFNGDLIANGANTSAAATTSQGFDNGGMVYYSTDFSSSSNGNPPCSNSGVPADITSGAGPVYHIASFVGQTLILNPGGGSGTLVFSNAGSFDHLSVLAASANSPSNTATLNVQVNFSDATHYTTTFIVGDWYSGVSNIAKSGLGRVNRTGDAWDQCGSFKLFDCIINLSAYSSKVATSIYCWNSDPAQRCAVFAVCGVTVANVPHAPIADPGTSLQTTSFDANWHPYSPDDHPPVTYVLDVSTDPNFGSFVGVYNNYGVGSVTTLPITGLTPGGTYYYRVRGINSFGSSPNSNVITVNLPSCANPTNGGTIAADQSHCDTFTPAAFTSTAAASGQTGTLEYKWQWSVYDFTTWTDIPSSNSATYAPGSISVTTKYKRLARVDCMNNWTGAAESNVVTVTINPLPAVFTVTGGTFCAGLGSIGLSGSAAGINYALFNGASLVSTLAGTGAALNFGTINDVGTYTIVATNATTLCPSNMTGSSVVNPLPTPVISGDASVTQNQTVTYSTPYYPGHLYSWTASHGNAVICTPNRNCLTITWDFPCGIISPGYVRVTETIVATGCVVTTEVPITIVP